ncbi:MAG: aminoglycoside phosphotransferase family protein [bacterium]|nr:aminoglycoside phosphotransferase family protein [bacterium]
MQNTEEEIIHKEKEFIRELISLDRNIEITFSDFGWTSRVYIINSGEIVFKFPRSEEVKTEYTLEVPAYKIAEEIDEVLIPSIQWEHPNKDYVGYKGIKGKSVDTVNSSLTKDEKRNIGTQVGAFLKKFHQLTIPDAPLMSLEKEVAEYQYKLELGLPEIEKHFSKTEVASIKQLLLEEYPHKMKEFGFNKCLCHGDLGYWNMIYSPDGRIGVIDFCDVGYYDNSIDFAGMQDEDMLNAVLDAYGEDVSKEKIALRMKVIPIIDLPFFIGKNDQKGIERTIERIRNTALK